MPGLARGVLGEAGAVEAAVGGAVAPAAAIDVGDSDFGDGGGDEGGTGSTGGRGLARGAALFSFMSTPVLISGCGKRQVAYLDRAITRTKPSNERSSTFIRCVHADTGTGSCIAGFLDAALYVVGAGAVACYVETLGCAVGCVLAGS